MPVGQLDGSPFVSHTSTQISPYGLGEHSGSDVPFFGPGHSACVWGMVHDITHMLPTGVVWQQLGSMQSLHSL